MSVIDIEREKEAKAFLRGVKRKKALVAESMALGAWDENVSQENKARIREISGKIMRLNRRLKNLKWSYWGLYPDGVEFYKIHPKPKGGNQAS